MRETGQVWARLRILVILLLSILLGHAVLYGADKPVAVLTGFEGGIVITKAGSEFKVESGMSLYSGMEVITTKGATAYILFEDNDLKVVEEDSKYVVEASRGKEAVNEIPDESETETARRQFKHLLVAMNYGFTTADTADKIYYPRHRTANLRPEFVWAADPKAQYSIEVLDSADKSVIKAQKAAPPFSYPKDAHDLEFGKAYTFKLYETLHDGSVRVYRESFKIIAKPEYERLQRDMQDRIRPSMDTDTKRYIKAQLYKKLRLYADAALVYREYLKMYPDAEFPQRELALCYSEIGLEASAKALSQKYHGKGDQ